MSRRSTTAVLTLLLCLVLPLSGFLVWAWMYPFGRRAALLPSMWGGLAAYASDHGGRFPESTLGPYDALATLYYSNYCTASELAGVSGSIDAAKSALEHREPLTQGTTSWIYFPGFRRDEVQDLAILWERTPGYYWNGRRNFFGGRPVLFANGGISNVPASGWEAFLRQQEELRRSLKDARLKSPTKVDGN